MNHAESVAHGLGHDQGYDEARAEFLSKLRNKLRRGEFADLVELEEWVEGRIAKAQDAGRWPEGW